MGADAGWGEGSAADNTAWKTARLGSSGKDKFGTAIRHCNIFWRSHMCRFAANALLREVFSDAC